MSRKCSKRSVRFVRIWWDNRLIGRILQETVTKTQFYEMEGILHKQTGEILTFVEAIRQGLLNLSAGGQFYDIISGQSVSLDKAVGSGQQGDGEI